MEIKFCQSKIEWDNFLLKCNQNEFLQSWNWGEFQCSVGHKPVRIQLVENDQVVWQGQGFKHRLVLGLKFLYVPRVMNMEHGVWNMEQVLLDFLKKNGYVFVRFEFVGNNGNTNNLHSSVFNLITVKNRQPHYTLILNLIQSAEELLLQMHPKTRYNINLAKKKGVLVKNEKNIDIFWRLNKETVKRDDFRSHNKKYYAKMLAIDHAYQLTAYFNNEPIAANICVGFGDTFTYLHGTSGNKWRNLMATYLLQWEGIGLARKLKCKYYDFWGVAPLIKNNLDGYSWPENHWWGGITRFKVGFGGEVKEYPEGGDVVLRSKSYKLFLLAKKILKY